MFEERLRHAARALPDEPGEASDHDRRHRPGDSLAESEAARRWAIANGVPAGDIITEAQSHTTKQNFLNALPLIQERKVSAAC